MLYAQLIGGLSSRKSILERGYWYQVESLPPGGFIRIVGPDSIRCTHSETVVRVVDTKPNWITRVPDVNYGVKHRGEVGPEGTGYYGVCPEGHRIEGLRGTESESECRECGMTYAVGDELRRMESTAT